MLSLTFIGTIIVGIISVIDLIFNLICELGVDQLRIKGGFYGGACFSITTTASPAWAARKAELSAAEPEPITR